MSSQTQSDADSYSPPTRLPSPIHQESSFPVVGILAGIGLAVLGGVVLFAVGQFIYIYILYNALLGIAVGWGLSFAPQKSRYTNSTILFLLTLACSFLVYLFYNIALFIYVVSTYGDTAGAGLLDWLFAFPEFLLIRAQNEPFINDLVLGAVGNLIVWIVEFAITAYIAWRKVWMAILVSHVESVPPEVVNFVVQMMANGDSQNTILQELYARSWSKPEDQQQALLAASSLISLARATKKDE